MTNPGSKPLQYSLAGLLGVVVLTFFGMALLVPFISGPLLPWEAAAIAVGMTWAGALAGLLLARRSDGRTRVSVVVGTIMLGWVVVLCFKFPFVGVFTSLGGLVGFIGAVERGLEGIQCTNIVIWRAVVLGPFFSILCAIAAPQSFALTHRKILIEADEIYHRTDYYRDGDLEYATIMKGGESLLRRKVKPEYLEFGTEYSRR